MASSATYNSPVSFFIAQSPPVDISDPEAAKAFSELYNAVQNIIQVFISNCGIGPQLPGLWAQFAGNPATLITGNLNRLYVVASELIVFGAAISLVNTAGVLNVRNANATNNTRICDGFCSTPGGIAAGAAGEVQLMGGVATISALTIAQRYWLSTTAGLVTNVAPVAAGNVEQYLGIAIDANDLFFNTQAWIQH